MLRPPSLLLARLALVAVVAVLGLAGCTAAVNPAFRYDEPDRDVASDVVLEGNRYDAAILARGEATWLAWLEYAPGLGDALWIGRRRDDAWIDRRELIPPSLRSRLARPTWTQTDSAVWLTWEQWDGTSWDLAWSRFDASGNEIARERLATPETNETAHAATARGEDRIWVVTRRETAGGSELALTTLGEETTRGNGVRWTVVRDAPARPWAPDIAGGPDTALVVWDEFDGDAFQVRAVVVDETGKPGPVVPMTDSDRFEARPVVDRASDGSYWVAWEEGERGWGARYIGNDMQWNNSTDDRGSLHRLRRVRVAHLDAQGRRLETPLLDLPAFADIDALGPRRDGVHEMGLYYERPEIVVDGKDRPWIAYRHFAQSQLGRPEITHHHIENGWHVYARTFERDGWSPLYRFEHDQRDGHQRLSLAPTADGVAAAWTTGRTDRREDDRPRGVATTRVARDGDGPAARRGESRDATPSLTTAGPRAAAPTTRVGGKTWHLAYGDLHRHTDLSLCFAFFDGSLDDAYRYARSVEQLDFLGITDHTRDIDQGDVQSLLWWRATKEVTRHHAPGVFHPFYAYERSQDDTDHNVISLRDDMLRNYPPPLPEFWAEIEDDQTITIPHTTHTIPDEPFNGKVWDYQDDARRPLAEVYQGFRDVSALRELQAPLVKGYHLGMIASSDHLSTGASYAAAWTESLDRDALFDSLRSRRTYGATDRIRLVFRSGDHWMGEIVRSNGPLPLQIEVEGTGPLEAVELWVDGKRRRAWKPKTESASLRVATEIEAPDRYAFIRVVQSDGNRAWSSPIWLEPPSGELGAATQFREMRDPKTG